MPTRTSAWCSPTSSRASGQAARRVSREFQEDHPDIPWSAIIGMRHRIVHDYLDANYDIVWDVATVEFPAVVQRLAPLLPPEDP
jgi:uncharacterized protein with HEPN domain